MSGFRSALALEQVEQDGDHDGVPEPVDLWRTTKPITYLALDGTNYTVPAGFVTDGASIPRALWTLVGAPLDTYAEAAVLHDYLYRTGCVDKTRADDLLLEAMAALDVGWFTRRTIYLGVHWFGGPAWAANRKLTEGDHA